MDLTHGGDIHGHRLRHGRTPLDFSASLNPLGMPPAVRAAARNAVDDAYAYPDPLCRTLTAELAWHLGVPGENLFCGNGAADVLYRLVWAAKPRTAMVMTPTFAEYERALHTTGCRIFFHALSPADGFILNEDILDKITTSLDMLFLCQPNNPTGRLIRPELLSAILERCRSTDTLLFFDECFCPFVDDPAAHSLIGKVESYPNLFILGSFTKLYGMAGIRLGYGVSGDRELAGRLADAGPPWPVSTMAQEAGIAALRETGYVVETRKTVSRAKGMLVDGLERLGITPLGADANFVFFHAAVPDLAELLAREDILIRDCGNFRGLERGYYRVSVRTEDENQLLFRTIAKYVNG